MVIHTFAGDDWRSVADHFRRLGLIGPTGRLCGAIVGPAATEAERPSLRARSDHARRLWEEAVPLGGTLSERHCRRRSIDGPPSDALRHHPGVASAVYMDTGTRRPALLAAIRTAEGELCGVELTYLAPNGDRARLATPRKTIGGRPAGAAVRLDPAGPRMVVGEGVFTTLSAGRRFGRPAWALLSVRNLVRWRAPPGVEDVLVAADRGAVGECGARRLVAALRSAGLRAAAVAPPAPYADWNDAAVAGVLQGKGGRGGVGKADGWSEPPAQE